MGFLDFLFGLGRVERRSASHSFATYLTYQVFTLISVLPTTVVTVVAVVWAN